MNYEFKKWHLILIGLIVLVSVYGMAPETAMNLIRITVEFLSEFN